jgi:hypothetical protein
MPEHRELWTCPRCGNAFVHRNASHSCVSVPLDSHFDGRAPHVRELFDDFVAACSEHVPVRIVSSKTRIALMDRVRFASVMPRKAYLRCGLWLARPVESPRVVRLDRYGERIFYVWFELRTPQDIDDEVRGWIAEAALSATGLQ